MTSFSSSNEYIYLFLFCELHLTDKNTLKTKWMTHCENTSHSKVHFVSLSAKLPALNLWRVICQVWQHFHLRLRSYLLSRLWSFYFFLVCRDKQRCNCSIPAPCHQCRNGVWHSTARWSGHWLCQMQINHYWKSANTHSGWMKVCLMVIQRDFLHLPHLVFFWTLVSSTDPDFVSVLYCRKVCGFIWHQKKTNYSISPLKQVKSSNTWAQLRSL